MSEALLPVELKEPPRSVLILLRGVSVLAFALAACAFFDIIFYWKFNAPKAEAWLANISLFALFLAQTILYSLRQRTQLAERYARAVLSVGEDKLKDYKHARRFEEIKEKADFQHNLQCDFRITQFGCQQVAMYDKIDWHLQPNMNVLLGRNGYGKSHLIRAMLGLLQRHEKKSEEFFASARDEGSLTMSLFRNADERHIICTRDGFEESIGKVPVLAIPDARLIDQSNDTLGQVNDEWNDLREHSASHFLFQRPYESIINTFLLQLCLDYLANKRVGFGAPIFQLVTGVIEALTRRSFAFHDISLAGNGRFRLEVITEGEADSPLPIQKASQGTLSVVAIFAIIYYYLEAITRDTSPPQPATERKAIVIIDEIDAHLHPIWQRRILGLLRSSFPNVQFIVTAHSPLVVGGCLNDEVAVLRRASEKSFTVFQFSHDFVGREIADIYSEVFDVEGLDDVYSHFIALSPQQDEIRRNVERLQAKGELDEPEGRDLNKFKNQLFQIQRVNQKQAKQVAYEDLRRENEMLKADNEKLKAQLSNLEPTEITTTS